MKTIQYKQFTFADTLFRTVEEMLKAQISWYYQALDIEEIDRLSEEEIKYDCQNMADNYIPDIYTHCQFPTVTFSREELSTYIFELIQSKLNEVEK